MLFIRASTHIKAGEEILISYFEPDRLYLERSKLFSTYGFTCTCELCELEDLDGNYIREVRDENLVAFVTEKKPLERVIRNLENLRGRRTELNVFLIGPYLESAHSFYDNMEYKKAGIEFQGCFDLCKVSAQYGLVGIGCAMSIATCYLRRMPRKSDMPVVQKWVDLAKECIQIEFGKMKSCVKIFEVIRPTFAIEMANCGLDLK